MAGAWRWIGMICLGLGIHIPASAQEGGTESPFAAPTGARQLALGGTSATVGEGADVLAHNVALLAWQPRGSIALFHSDLYTPETSLQAGYVAYPTVDFGTFALGLQRLGVGGIEGRDDRNVPRETFEVSEVHALLGYARSIQPWLAAGATLRILQQSVADARATATAVDVGLVTRRDLPLHGHALRAGLVVRNLVRPRLRLDEDEVDDPSRLALGAVYEWAPDASRLHALVATEWSRSATADTRWGVGVEVGLDRTFFLRAGLDEGHPAAGVGVSLRGVDFAFATRTDEDLPRDDRFTLGVHFGSTVERRLAERSAAQEARVARRLETLLDEREAEALSRARDEAATAWAARDYEQVEVLYRRVLLIAPDDPIAEPRIDEARRMLALEAAAADLDAGMTARAATAFQRILDRWPSTPEAEEGLRRARSELASDRDRRGQVRELFSDALARFTDGDLLGARTALEALAGIEPDHEGARELAARIQSVRRERIDGAVDRAEARAERQDWEGAIASLGVAVRLDPEGRASYEERIAEWTRLSEERRRRNERIAAAPAAADVPGVTRRPEPSRDDLLRLQQRFGDGMRLYESGDYERATRTWREVWDVDPGYAEVGTHLVKAHLLLGIGAYTEGEYARAIDHCRRALEIDPEHEKARRYLARIEEERSEVRQLDEWRSRR